jgi:hypothetical protein
MFLIHIPLGKVLGMAGQMEIFIRTLIGMSISNPMISKFIGPIRLLVEIVQGMNMHQLGKRERKPQGAASALLLATMTIAILLSGQRPTQRQFTSSSTNHVFGLCKFTIKHAKCMHFLTNGLKAFTFTTMGFMLIIALVVFSIYSTKNDSTLKL